MIVVDTSVWVEALRKDGSEVRRQNGRVLWGWARLYFIDVHDP
jgi:hypothetical protein